MSNIDVKQYEFNELSRKSDIKSAIESMLFVSGEPLPLREISNNLELKEKNVVEILQEMTTEYEDKSRGIRLISLDEAYQLVTKSENSEFVQKLLKKNKKHSLSQASIESLAIIAYKQPITRIDIDEIRGVKSESAITRLVERGLIKDVGRLEVPGRPILYGTTDEFLRQFGLKTIKELPSLDLYGDFKESEISQIYDDEDFGYTKITVERPLRDEEGNLVLKKGKKQPDTSLRDTENVPLKEDIKEYFEREVLPFAPDAWVDEKKTQVGYEISFTKYFYKPVELRDMSDILSNLSSLEQEADGLLAEIMGGVR